MKKIMAYCTYFLQNVKKEKLVQKASRNQK